MAILELKNITKSYFLGKEEFPVLKGINLEVDRGDFVSLLGESGGGKTTLMNIIGGLDRKYHGEVLIDGQAQKSKKEKDMDAYRRDTIGFIFQSFNLVSYLSVLDNVLVSLKMTNLSEKDRAKRALELIKQVGLYDHRKKKPAQLSGGQKQRVAIARALASDPEIILADEPTGALDSANTKEVLEILESIAKSGKTIIVVTHSQEVANHGTRIVHLEDGKIIDDKRIKEAYLFEKQKRSFKPKALSYWDTFKMAFKHFINARTQNLLIAIGSAIGLASVMFFLGLGNGATKYMNSQVTSIANPNVLMVVKRAAADQTSSTTDSSSSSGSQSATQAQQQAYQNATQAISRGASTQFFSTDEINKLKTVKNVSDVNQGFLLLGQGTMKYGDSTTVSMNTIVSWSNILTTTSIENGSKPSDNEVAIPESVARKLDSNNFKNVIGKNITVTMEAITDTGVKPVTMNLKVSGVIQDVPGSNYPYTTAATLKNALQTAGLNTEPNWVTVTINNVHNVKDATSAIQGLKDSNGKLLFATNGIGSILDTITTITSIVSSVLAAIAGISLLVSIFMIVVTTYMSVAARTKEIGIIRAMGGRKRDISRLFTSESLILGIFSALLGIGLAFLAQVLINVALHGLVGADITQINLSMVILAVIIALLIAILASLAPSGKAARLNTIEALATE